MVRRSWLVSPSQHSVYVQSDVHQARANHRRGQSQVINETSALPLPSNRKARSRRWSVSCRRSPLLSPLLYHGPPLIEFTRPGWVALPESLFMQSPLTTTRCSVSDFRESGFLVRRHLYRGNPRDHRDVIKWRPRKETRVADRPQKTTSDMQERSLGRFRSQRCGTKRPAPSGRPRKRTRVAERKGAMEEFGINKNVKISGTKT